MHYIFKLFSFSARQGLFGITGPGKRKRRDAIGDSSGINTQMFLQFSENTF